MKHRAVLYGLMLLASSFAASAATPVSETAEDKPATSVNAHDIVAKAIDHWRGLSSYSEMTMTINRPDWQRSVSMMGWTQGSEQTLIRITAPKKDVGNGTLLKGNAMWSFAPKINRVVKIPSSMMGQSWMGSDFSNNDVARSDDIVDQYSHRLLSQEQHEAHNIYVIEAIPYEDSAVVWGREVLRVRDDYVLLQHQFFDQDDLLVKQLNTLSIKTMDGRPVAAQQRMQKQDATEEWTEIIIHNADFDIDVSPRQFTLSNLRNPRP
ncbi:MAG: outer membrane lipoprotein-sorting protein [Cellvibrionaceae bacterium]|nr:outer membrane lipoprotein-sorting protein [Cellvibrionaceae bacterium]|tara:strand:+ start:6560 stop:7354 length:795 start_codon:yes stop_codon:yes gene_type:complete